jgi:hypothetical protein
MATKAAKQFDPGDREFIQIYSLDCLQCTHLVTEPGVDFKECHFSNGNRFCPAQGIGITVVGEAYRLAEQVHAARDRRDAKSEAAIMTKVAKKNDYFRERFYWAVEDRTRFEQFTNKVN